MIAFRDSKDSEFVPNTLVNDETTLYIECCDRPMCIRKENVSMIIEFVVLAELDPSPY